MNKAIKAILRYLYQEYLKSATVSYTINAVAASYKADPIAISAYLLEKNWIRERWIFEDNRVSCRITIAGIEEVDRTFIHNRVRRVIGGLIEEGGTRDLKEILESKLDEFAINMDIVFQLEKLAMVRVEHHSAVIIISLTEYGRQFFLRKKNSPFVLMAVA